MEDAAIVALYHARDPAAVERTQEKYARYLYTVAHNILADHLESEETVNDTYVKAWHSMPPQAPSVLSTYLSRLARGAAIDRLRARGRQRRSAFVTALSELAADIPAADNTQTEAELRALAAAVEAFLRTQMLLGADALDKLSRCHVIVFGLGGVGSYAAECLARSGVGELTLVDQDTLSLTNINRQLYALHSTVGQYKAEAAARRCLDINPDLRVHPVCATYDAAHRDDFFTAHYDYIVDAIDLVSCKLDLIEQARLRRIPILTALGTGNKLDPTLLQVTDISKTSGCPLARVMRKELRARDIHHLKVVFSPEQPAETQQLEAPPPGRRSVPASVAWVPATAGLLMGSVVVRDLISGGGLLP